MIERRVVNLMVVAALVLGIGLYNVVPLGSGGDERGAAPAAAAAPVDRAGPATGAPAGTDTAGSVGGSFGSGTAALDAGVRADQVAGSGSGVDGLPGTPSTPTPTVPPTPCATDAASDAFESVAGPLGDALGQQLPEDNLRVLAEIAAGCTSESPATPLIGLALDIGRLVPETGLPPADLSAIPAVPAPALPPQVLDALAPFAAPVQEACATIGLLGVLVAVLPGAANVPVHGEQLGDALVPAQTLCAQLEG